MILGGLCVTLLAAVVVLILRPGLVGIGGTTPGHPLAGLPGNTEVGKGPDQQSTTSPTAPFEKGQFPRRLLSINISNYLYANPLHSGKSYALSLANPALATDTRDVHDVVRQIADKWRIPDEQVFELGDTLDENPLPPLKGMITETIKRFLESSRSQDRLLILFTGHALAIDEEAYLVPMEGEFDDPESLIPVKWFYEQLEKCPAQEKLVIYDVCRYNSERGKERIDAGPMSPELEQALHSSPAGVHVWSACSQGQYSYEYEFDTFEGQAIWGSGFLNSFFYASRQGKLGSGRQTQSDPLPIDRLTPLVNKYTQQMISALENAEQTPKFTPATLTETVVYNPDLPPPSIFDLPVPPEGAKKEKIAALMDQIRVPPIKLGRKGESPFRVEMVYPFPKDVMANYQAEPGLTRTEILRNPHRWPVREVTLRAVDLLRELRETENEGEQILPEEFRGETSDNVKAEILAIQRIPATQVRIFSELNTEMNLIAESDLEFEESKRWVANFHYVHAQVKARLAYLNEYNLMLGKVRKDELPPLDESQAQIGWRLASVEKMSSPRDIRDIAREADDILEELIESHPNTPWAVLAKRQKATSLGLRWEASNFGQQQVSFRAVD